MNVNKIFNHTFILQTVCVPKQMPDRVQKVEPGRQGREEAAESHREGAHLRGRGHDCQGTGTAHWSPETGTYLLDLLFGDLVKFVMCTLVSRDCALYCKYIKFHMYPGN